MSIRVDKISRTFGDTVALSQVSFSVGPGITGLLGHNGAGKSTLLSLLAGYSSPDEGTVRILDADPRIDRQLHRRHVRR
jgi:ABC-2 type transport system ATP-binding protein